MMDLSKTYLFRMTHIENIPHVLRHGITHAQSSNSNPAYISIGDSSLINSRSSFILNNGNRLGDYIPFYFGVRTPMLYVMQKGFNWVKPTPAQDIVYCVSSVQKIIDYQLNFVFTNGHAVDVFTSQYSEAEIENLDTLIDWNAVKAEFLVRQDISIAAILGYFVYNEEAKIKLIQWGVIDNKVYVKPDYYF
jgi:hypothetical protein